MKKCALVAALTLAGCYGGMTRRDELLFSINQFNDGIRWGKIEQSAKQLPVERRQKFADRWSSIEEELEIHDYEVERVELGSDTADVRVAISWSSKRQGLLERTVITQHWQERRGTWTLTSQSRLKGVPFPLFDEPPRPAAGTPAAPSEPPPSAP